MAIDAQTTEKTPDAPSFYRRHFRLLFEIALIGLITLDYAFGTGLSHHLGNWFYVFPSLILLITGIPYLRRFRLLAGTYESIFSSHLLGVAFILLFTPLFSPYYALLFMLLYIAAYYQERSGTIISMTFIGAVFVGAAIKGGDSTPIVSGESIIVSAALFFIISLFMEYMIRMDRTQRRAVHSASTQAALASSRLAILLSHITETCFGVTKNGTVIFYNQAALELLPPGIDPGGALLQELIPFRSETDQAVDLTALCDRAERGSVQESLHILSPEGRRVELNVSVAAVSLQDEGLSDNRHYILIIKNTTAEKRLEEERKNFLAITSHELRTPLTAVRSTISLLKQQLGPKLSPEEMHFIDAADAQMLHITEIANDILLLAEAQRKLLPIDLKMVEPMALLTNLKDMYQDRVQKKQLAFELDIHDQVHPLLTSEDTISHILGQYLSNAVKYTEHGSITLGVTNGEKGSLTFFVRDTGIGIPKSDQHKLFQEFSQVEDFLTRNADGIGLGLYTTTKLAARINAKVWADSEPNQGSIFYLEVPSQSYLASDQARATEVELDHLVQVL
jgi:signal transduction histidine kinase